MPPDGLPPDIGPLPYAPVPSPAPFPIGLLARLPIFAALGFREFRLIWGAQFCNAMGINMDQVARGWLMYDLTGSTVQLGLVSAVRILPIILLAPIAGVMADRSNRKIQLLVAQSVNGALNFLLAALILSGRIEVWHVYATGFVVAIVQVFEIPARISMVPESVDRAHLTNAIGLGAVGFNISQSLGPAAAGALIALVGPGGSYLAQGLVYLLSSVWTVQLHLTARVMTSRSPNGSILKGTIEGWSYVIHHPTIRGAMTMVWLTSLFGMSLITLVPVFARDILEVGPTGQGLLITGLGLGSLAGAFLIAAKGDRFPKGKIMLAGGMLFGVAELGFGLSTNFGLSVGLMALMGIAGITCTALVNTVLQGHSAPDMRGRVSSVFQQSQLGFTVGGLMVGSLAALIGSPLSVSIMGLAYLVGAIAIAIGMPSVRAIRQ